MRNRTEEINVRVFKTEKNLIRRKARKCGMNMSEYGISPHPGDGHGGQRGAQGRTDAGLPEADAAA